MSTIVPPGGFAGFAQMTPASQNSLRRGTGSGRVNRGPKRRRSKATTTRRRAKKRAKTARSAARKLVKGSAAAKRYMAKLRRMRKR